MDVEEMNARKTPNELNFEEFLAICSDSGIVEEKIAREIVNYAKCIGGVAAIPKIAGKQLNSPCEFAASLISIYPEDMTFNNYVTTEENYYATEIARTIALIPRVWKSITPIMLHANTGQGKTHLLAAITRSTRKKTLILNTVDLHIEYKQCFSMGMDKKLRDWIASHDLLMLDDIQFSQGDLQFQEFLISVINHMPRGKHGIITSSDVHPAELLDIDASFYSRLTSGLVIKLEMVNYEGRKAILRNLFNQISIRPNDEIIDFIATSVTMNVRQLKAAGRMVIAQMLGPSHEVTIDTVKGILGFMQIQTKDEHRPKASEFNVKEMKKAETTVDPTPFIVVDIDEEVRIQKTPAETRKEAEPGDTAGVDDDEHIFREEMAAASMKSGSSDTSKYKNMVESAKTVDHQVEALKQAVEFRIEQLENKSVDSKEIEKLRFALTFLNEGKLESAMCALKPD